MSLSSLIEKYFSEPGHEQARDVYFNNYGRCACALGAAFLQTHDKIPVPCDDDEPDGTAWVAPPENSEDMDEHEALKSLAKKIYGVRKWPFIPKDKLPGFEEGKPYGRGMEYKIARCGGLPLDDTIITLNDVMKWSWREIVEWLKEVGQ